MNVFVECLTLRTWVQGILPSLIRQGPRAAARWYVVDASRLGLAAARLTGRLLGVSLEPLAFRMEEIRDAHGRSVWLRMLYQDLLEVHAEVMREPAFHAVGARAARYLAKVVGASTANMTQRQTLWRALLVIQVCAWKVRREAGGGGQAVCFLERRPWDAAVARYASAHGITCVPIPPTPPLRSRLTALVSPELRRGLGDLRGLWQEARRRRRPGASRPPPPARASQAAPGGARIAVDYWGHLNLADPSRHSNLFFWQQSSLPADRLVVTFDLPQAPLDDAKWAELARHGMSAIALRPEATTLPWASACVPPRRPGAGRARTPERIAFPAAEGRWLARHLHAYRQERAFWAEFAASQRIKIYVSWFRITERFCAIADALHDRGGISAIYQRSVEMHPSPQLRTAADVMFGCSAMSADVERRAGSTIPYFVVTGYLGDHRAALWRTRAQEIRQRLHGQGARRLLAFCDENSSDDDRWVPGHALPREAYAFLLERLLQEPWLGLLLKPKTPQTLRRRLGPVAALLARAEATGRCVVFEDGRIQGSTPPVAAALAADVMVHGHLYGATAGVESALAGVPTLLMDREGWPVSPLYRLGLGRVVFTDWPALWEACCEHWRRPGGVPGFGAWASIVDELDPFRDGRAAERMGTYLQWLLEGFDAGWDRQTVLAAAAERYAAQWGQQTVMSINTPPRAAMAASSRIAGDVPVEQMASS